MPVQTKKKNRTTDRVAWEYFSVSFPMNRSQDDIVRVLDSYGFEGWEHYFNGTCGSNLVMYFKRRKNNA